MSLQDLKTDTELLARLRAAVRPLTKQEALEQSKSWVRSLLDRELTIEELKRYFND